MLINALQLRILPVGLDAVERDLSKDNMPPLTPASLGGGDHPPWLLPEAVPKNHAGYVSVAHSLKYVTEELAEAG
jgi:hypothetical protein